ncbi:hypothetical protein SERLA73DRAFT_91705, partial [Serpula lacrymans var. lacrymans S7.3]
MSEQLLDTPSKHPFSVLAVLDNAWSVLREKALTTAWPPLIRVTETAVITLMQKITSGHLRVLTYSQIYAFPSLKGPNPKDDLKAELRVIKDTFWIRLVTMGDLGFSEAYMYGDVECDDLVALFKIFLHNRQNLVDLDSKASYLFTLPQKITSYRFLNTISNSRCNISAHYDISNEMFAGFLSEDMTYSCAIFDTLDADLKGGQLRKLRHIIAKAKISSNQRVLEIGSGWGSLSILIAQTFPGTTVDTITLSVHQQTMALARIKAADMQDRIKVHLMDYRAMPFEWKGLFDRVVSIEMIEAVGSEFIEKYWSVVDWALKEDGGVGVVQVITIPEALFPGGFLPTVTLLLQAMEKGSSGRLIVDSISNIGPHYARTLREWRKRFISNFDSVIVPALKTEYPSVMGGPKGREEIEVFKRKWLCACYCEVGFTTRTLGG